MMFPDGATHGLCNQFNIPSTYWLISSHTCILVSIQVHFKKKKKKSACSSSGCLCGRHHLLSSEICIPKQVSAAAIVSFPLKSFRPHLRSKSLTAAGRRDRFCRAIQKKKKKCIKKSLSRTTTTHPRRGYSVSRREARDECPNNLLR